MHPFVHTIIIHMLQRNVNYTGYTVEILKQTEKKLPIRIESAHSMFHIDFEVNIWKP